MISNENILRIVAENLAEQKDAAAVASMANAVPTIGKQVINNTPWWRMVEKEFIRKETDQNGKIVWYKNNKIHRDGNEPAIIHPDGTQEYYKHGLLHRDNDEPAVIQYFSRGGYEKLWYQNGRLHRDGDKPAITDNYGSELYFKNSRLHRDGHKAAVIHHYPAIQEWCLKGIIYIDDDVFKAWKSKHNMGEDEIIDFAPPDLIQMGKEYEESRCD